MWNYFIKFRYLLLPPKHSTSTIYTVIMHIRQCFLFKLKIWRFKTLTLQAEPKISLTILSLLFSYFALKAHRTTFMVHSIVVCRVKGLAPIIALLLRNCTKVSMKFKLQAGVQLYILLSAYSNSLTSEFTL